MKSILLHIGGDTAMEARLQVALDIARATNAHITCLQAVSYEVFAPGDFYGSAVAAAMPRIREAAEALREKLETHLEKEDVSWEWQFFSGMAETHLLEQSALHDLILVGPTDIGSDGTRLPSSMAGDLAIRAPTPVLVVPRHIKGFDVRAPVLVGWNGSAESCLALRGAVPLLAMADMVYLASIEERSDRRRFDFPPTDGARYLSRHGIETEIISIPRGEAKVADTLFSAAQFRECGMIVMGAYGHSRLAELLLGGVTRRSLTDPQLPIFMAH
ncbi:MAG: universal stress protein [Pseudomonadota bacterium]